MSNFDVWTSTLNTAIINRFGLGLEDLGDFDIFSVYEQGADPNVYAVELGDTIEREITIDLDIFNKYGW